ncbi:hypothetical protein [Nodosilinea sp. FACHB-141]|nr:hypothetical protein [Nodosilinea sp. FACHB-141]
MKSSYLKEGLLLAVARKQGVSTRRAHLWSAAGSWAAAQEDRTSGGGPPIELMSFTAEPGDPQATQQPEVLQSTPQTLADLIQILDEAIARVSAAIRSPHDGRNRANCAGTLAKLTDQRAKLSSTNWLVSQPLDRYPNSKTLLQALKDARSLGAAKKEHR